MSTLIERLENALQKIVLALECPIEEAIEVLHHLIDKLTGHDKEHLLSAQEQIAANKAYQETLDANKVAEEKAAAEKIASV